MVLQLTNRSRRRWQSDASSTIRSLPVAFLTQALISPAEALGESLDAEAKAPPPTASASTAVAVASEVVLAVESTTHTVEPPRVSVQGRGLRSGRSAWTYNRPPDRAEERNADSRERDRAPGRRGAWRDPDPRAPAHARRGERQPVPAPLRRGRALRRRRRGRQGRARSRREDDRRADRDVPRPRRELHPACVQGDRPAGDRLHRHLHLRPPAAVLAEPLAGRDGRRLRARHRAGHPGHRHQGGLPQVRGRRAGRERERREGPSRVRAREPEDRRADHGPLAPGVQDRPAPGGDPPRGGRGAGEDPDRPLRRHATTSATSRG